MLVHVVECLKDDGTWMTHIFSTKELAEAFADTDPRDHVIYDYVLDCPERAEHPCN